MDYNDIKNLINDIGKSNVDEVNLEFPDGIKISVKKNNQVVKEVCKENVSKIIENKETVAIAKENTDNYKTIKSPMVGTFYTKSEPTAKPYVKVGDKVVKGQVLCILEAMKLMNEIESEYDGEIVEICAKDDDMVEYGEVLFKIK
jgi:acetyl-CoA carboxylase biotin carboxyl carrier protein